MLWKIAVALLFLLCQNTFAIIHFHCIFTSPSPHIQRWQTIQIKFLTHILLLTPSKLLDIHLSGCYLVNPGPFGLLLVLGLEVWTRSTVSNMILCSRIQKKVYDCGISCSAAAPEHQEIALLNTLAICSKKLVNLTLNLCQGVRAWDCRQKRATHPRGVTVERHDNRSHKQHNEFSLALTCQTTQVLPICCPASWD